MPGKVGRVLITGGESMMAEYLIREFEGATLSPNRRELDISDRAAFARTLREQRVDTVINTAGVSNSDRRTTFEVNALAPAELAEECRKHGAAFVFISSGRVFDGCSASPYLESDLPHPLDDYGLSKRVGEQLIENILQAGRFYIFRLPMVLGLRRKHPEGQIVTRLLSEARIAGHIRVADDVFHTPVYAGHAARMMRLCMETDGSSGIYHLSGEAVVSLSELTQHILRALNVPARVVSVSADTFDGSGRSPRNQSLGSERVQPLPGWREATDHFLNDILQEQ
jgi:dTDP-4-dehydrorhamnose reductase